MDIPELSELQRAWFTEEKRKLEDSKKRRYLHFDSRIYTLAEKQTAALISPDHVIRNSFYPFIRDDKIQRRYKWKDGKRIIEPKIRPISYAAHADALIYSFYTTILNRAYEAFVRKQGISDNVLAYRRLGGKSTLDFASEVFELIRKSQNCIAICFDIKGFFDNLDHNILKTQWQRVLEAERLPNDHFAIYKSMTTYSYVRKDDLVKRLNLDKRKLGSMSRYCTVKNFHKKVQGGKLIQVNADKGIPQGSPISAVLSNIYMIDFDLVISKYIANMGGLYRRYCDDIIVVVPTAKKTIAEKFVIDEIAKLNLDISPEKTDIVEFEKDKLTIEIKDGHGRKRLQYLGLEFDGKNIYLRHRGLASFQRRMAKAVHGAIGWAKKENKNRIPKRRLYEKFSVYGKQNYLIYARRAATKLNSSTVARQTQPKRMLKLLKKRIKKDAG